MLSHFPTPGDKTTVCPLPDPAPRPPARFALPRGAVDTHAHVIGPPPYNPARSYTPSPHPCEEYLAMLDAVGFTYGVLVQITVHGTDNGLMLDALARAPQRLRGVAVVPPDVAERELQRCAAANVKGLRLVVAAGGGVGLQHLARYEAICVEMGWHLQVLIDASQIGDAARGLGRLRVPVVIDHLGYFAAGEPADSKARTLMRALLADGAWVKLSGAFRLAKDPPYRDVAAIAREYLEIAPDRCVWGSDWPHIGFWGPMPNVGDLLDLLPDWAEPASIERILVGNPARLYGFPPPP